ncbi:MAG: ankyrin repeat domain-containing protein [Spirochaetales bacterium]|nr:ankyrin repeat domain-containing protein [Spirochaetales bacterium]
MRLHFLIFCASLCIVLTCKGEAPSGTLDWSAIEQGDLQSMGPYLEKGGDPSARHSGPTGWHLLHFAARWGNNDMVEKLLQRGAQVDATTSDGWTPLFFASMNGHTATVKLLLAKGARAAARASDGSSILDLVDSAEIEEILTAAGATR